VTPNAEDRKRAADLWEILSTQDEKAVVQIAQLLADERRRTLALPEVVGIENVAKEYRELASHMADEVDDSWSHQVLSADNILAAFHRLQGELK
jgi:hypothetical protein